MRIWLKLVSAKCTPYKLLGFKNASMKYLFELCNSAELRTNSKSQILYFLLPDDHFFTDSTSSKAHQPGMFEFFDFSTKITAFGGQEGGEWTQRELWFCLTPLSYWFTDRTGSRPNREGEDPNFWDTCILHSSLFLLLYPLLVMHFFVYPLHPFCFVKTTLSYLSSYFDNSQP